MEPREHERFYPSKVKEQIESVVQQHIKDQPYDHATAKQLAETIADQIKANIKENCHIPNYKIVVQTVIGEIGGQGIRVASKCLWDEANDNFASFTYQNQYLFCTGIVFGIYYE